MHGTDAATGKTISGIAHLHQSIRDILTTPLGSRVMRRDYGSRLFELVDRPVNPALTVELYAATAEALAKWEPRFRLTTVFAESIAPGQVVLTMTGRYLPNGQEIKLEGIVV
ncbi:MAG: GPW/gp25 family protein [Proteobacteria bacterium]|nr:GPW/gp25 family protein [Pseudomonadota bacterium]MBU1640067.1 GPW/gp25 family protein [Pseudomonadota bacterium]